MLEYKYQSLPHIGRIRTTVGASGLGAPVVKIIDNVSFGPTFDHHVSVRLITCSSASAGYMIFPVKTLRL
jgi:hypothetical protein